MLLGFVVTFGWCQILRLQFRLQPTEPIGSERFGQIESTVPNHALFLPFVRNCVTQSAFLTATNPNLRFSLILK